MFAVVAFAAQIVYNHSNKQGFFYKKGGPMRGKCVADSALDNQKHGVRPEHLNNRNTVFGGHVMSLIDTTAAIVARKHAEKPCVTVSIDSVHFISPIYPEDHIVMYAAVNRTWRTSLEVGVKVFAENPETGERRHVASAYLTFVALDENNRPAAVPSLIPKTAENRRRYKEANIRRTVRLKLRRKNKK